MNESRYGTESTCKRLSEMTLEELWRLFPIVLTEHLACWAEWFAQETELLSQFLPAGQVVKISHIGSTAVDFIRAKPIVDILAEVRADCPLTAFRVPLEQAGYVCMSERAEQISWNKGYTENGFAARVFHLHLRHEGDHDELYFRDWLIEKPAVARQYEVLKLDLCERFRHDRDGYTAGKTAFVTAQTELAKRHFAGRYEQRNASIANSDSQ